MAIFTRRDLAETAYRLRRATDRHVDVEADEATRRLRRVVIEAAAARVDRAFVAKILDAADVPIGMLLGGANVRWRSGRKQFERLGNGGALPDVCLWSFAWWATFNVRVPTWGVAPMRAIWSHAGGAIRDDFNAGAIVAARRRIRGLLSS